MDIEILQIEENSDGSAIITLKLSEESTLLLIEKGFNSILKDYIDGTCNK